MDFMSDPDNVKQLAEKFGYLPYMIDRYIQFLGLNDTLELLKANEKPLRPSIRVNTLKISVSDLKTRLEKKGFKVEPVEQIPDGLKVLKEPLNLGSLHEFLQGYFYLQNIASMYPPLILNPTSDHLVLDMCAAPGGKSTHLAQLMNNKGCLLLVEKYSKRIPSLKNNLRRLGITNSIILNYDSRNMNKLDFKPDKILLDAPCTGEGLIRQDKTRKKSKSMENIKKLSNIQKELLSEGLKILKPGGELLYSTCSIAPEENEIVVHEVLDEKDGFIIQNITKPFGVSGLNKIFGKDLRKDIENSLRIYPHLHDTIGFFICLIRKLSTA
ncbi:MAG: NOL1/NOP2/sun family putative RNA methylase [Candidatus Lokiarchaeota archaeon]|nr:NOL1/NOP2/sun family putative RNA methylase [Candidatus Lokiarchaeota archaeon]